MALLDDMVAKYGGEDEAYKTKLKENIRGAFGYSNYVNKANEAAGKPLSLNLEGDITPSGVKSLVGGAMDMNKSERDAAGNLAGAIDAQAGTLASAQAAREKAAAAEAKDAQGLENGVAFEPKDELDNEILAYKQNPTNPDGSTKSLQQFEAELIQKYGEEASQGQFSADGQSLTGRNATKSTEEIRNEIKDRFNQRIESDWIGNEDKYHYMSQGYSDKQAEGLQGGLNYAQMSDERKLIYSVRNPAMSRLLDEGAINKDFIQDLGTETGPGGTTVPKKTYEELIMDYPSIPKESLKELVAPGYKKALEGDMSTWYSGDIKEAIQEMVVNEDGSQGYLYMKGDPLYKDKLDKFMSDYQGVFNKAEIESIIRDYILSHSKDESQSPGGLGIVRRSDNRQLQEEAL